MDFVENHCQNIDTLQREVESVQANASKAMRAISDMESRIDDGENRARRNNLIFFGNSDPGPSESAALVEEKVIRFCADHLDITLNPEHIERAHRLGRHCNGRNRPIIIKFSLFKIEEKGLSNSRKLKAINYRIGEDFSRPV